MMEYEQIIEALIGRVRGLRDRRFRVHRISREMTRFSDFEVVNILEELYRGAIRKKKDYLLVLDALTQFDVLRAEFGPRLSAIFEIADTEGFLLAAEWLAPLPIQQKTPKGLRVHHDLEDVTLGERRFVARSADPQMLEKLLVDPDPGVIKNLLRHPRLKEEHVLKICSKTPTNPDIMTVVYHNRRWFTRYLVKKALLNNPATPARIVMLVLVHLSVQDLRDLLRSRRFSPGFIRQILAVRRATPESESDPQAASDSVPAPPPSDWPRDTEAAEENDDDEQDTDPQLH